MNASPTEPVHFLQIWIEPERPGLEPSYEQRAFAGDGLQVVASPDGRDGSLRIHRDASILLGNLGSGDRAEHALEAGRGLWIHVATGAVAVDGEHLEAGDGLGIRAEECIALIAEEEARVLLFDLGS
jgi:redox-sensitive bicupin YhaK (pirin superfamily)